MKNSCGRKGKPDNKAACETIEIEKTSKKCGLCEDYAKLHSDKRIAVLSCEGACLRGELSRRAANLLCHKLMPAETVRICLGGAFTKDTGQRGLVRNAGRVVALEGCLIECASRMMKGAIPGLKAEVIITDRLSDFDKGVFGLDGLSDAEISRHSELIAGRAAEMIKKGAGGGTSAGGEKKT